jgi:hypothetical protein
MSAFFSSFIDVPQLVRHHTETIMRIDVEKKPWCDISEVRRFILPIRFYTHVAKYSFHAGLG